MSITKDPDLLYADEGEEKNKVNPGWLYLVTTPIGNLSDISERGLKVLSEVDFVAAEDTRNSGSMLARFGISIESFSGGSTELGFSFPFPTGIEI